MHMYYPYVVYLIYIYIYILYVYISDLKKYKETCYLIRH